ncbi:MAG: thiamine phosphate synthase [Gemmatimonadota bacterium]
MTAPTPHPRTDLRGRLSLIVITDDALAGERGVESVVADALAAGAPCIQLRRKWGGSGTTFRLAQRLREMTAARGALLIVNDRVDIALASGADGVHLGPHDLPVARVRRLVPSTFIVGYSTDHPEDARRAEAEGASYLGCGTVWPTETKGDAGEAIGTEGLAAVAASVSIPVVGIGGISPSRAALLRATGAVGVAVVGAVMAAEHPGLATRQLLEALAPLE